MPEGNKRGGGVLGGTFDTADYYEILQKPGERERGGKNVGEYVDGAVQCPRLT